MLLFLHSEATSVCFKLRLCLVHPRWICKRQQHPLPKSSQSFDKEELHFMSICVMSLECEKEKLRSRRQRKICFAVKMWPLVSLLELQGKKTNIQTDCCHENGSLKRSLCLDPANTKNKGEKSVYSVSLTHIIRKIFILQWRVSSVSIWT